MEVQSLKIPDIKLIKLKTFFDNRGFFTERFQMEKFKALQLPTHFVQDNFSRSNHKVLRGLHFQTEPQQGKLVTCLQGEIFDVCVDVRKSSPTYGQHISVVLNGNEPSCLWIPAGFAHGFCVLSATGADVMYKVDSAYNPKTEGCISWNAKDLNIAWPIKDPILSDKDAKGFDSYTAVAL